MAHFMWSNRLGVDVRKANNDRTKFRNTKGEKSEAYFGIVSLLHSCHIFHRRADEGLPIIEI